jgi:UDP-N-acetyl-2-amino-2-deoxyglucuronate dehydrogenase
MTNEIRFALVGCGRISNKHLEAINSTKNAKIVAVCDEIELRAKNTAEKYCVDYYTSYEDMLQRNDIDVISVCTPSGLHSQHGIMAAEKGFHVISEKPLATSLDDADRLIQTCEKNKAKLFTVYQNRFNSTLQLVKKAIDEKKFGKIYMVASNVFWNRTQAYYDMDKWRGTWKLDGGAFMNQGIHYIDMLLWLFGDMEEMYSITGTLARDIEAEDSGSAIFKFKSGAIGSMNITVLTYKQNYEGSITIIGEKGTAKIGGIALNKIEKWEFSDEIFNKLYNEKKDYNPLDVYGFGHQFFYENVINSLSHKIPFEIDGQQGRRSLEIILKIYEQQSKSSTA